MPLGAQPGNVSQGRGQKLVFRSLVVKVRSAGLGEETWLA
jgi:hypothetical protein